MTFNTFNIKVDLGEIHVLTGVATQGREGRFEQYISKYYVGYSSDGKNFQNLTDERGNLVVSIQCSCLMIVRMAVLKCL